MNCQPIRFLTPKRFLLDGLWFFTPSSKQAIIFVHGLGGAMLWPDLVYKLADKQTSVLTFNNRGNGVIAKVRYLDKKGNKNKILGGAAHEIFTDCVDDIQGAVDFCHRQGFKKIILVGHSTGCQKSVYYLSRVKNQKQIAKLILLCPISDYASAVTFDKKYIKKATELARRLVKTGKKHELLPTNIWPFLHDAQRFLSLFTATSKEEIFSYATPQSRPRTLQKVTVPMLVVFAEKDEYLDRPLAKVLSWFKDSLVVSNADFKIIKGANHGFVKREQVVIKAIKQWS